MRFQDYQELAHWFAGLLVKLYKRCVKCCTGRDLDKEEEQAHYGFRSWSHIRSTFERAARLPRSNREESQKLSKHPEWRHGQTRSWQLVAMQSNTMHEGALDQLHDTDADNFFVGDLPNTVADGEKKDSEEMRALRRQLALAEAKIEQAGARISELVEENREMARFENAQRARVGASLNVAQFDRTGSREREAGVSIRAVLFEGELPTSRMRLCDILERSNALNESRSRNLLGSCNRGPEVFTANDSGRERGERGIEVSTTEVVSIVSDVRYVC